MPGLEFRCRNMVTVWLEPCGAGTRTGAETSAVISTRSKEEGVK